MADGTKIEWTDATVNAVNGCTVLSPGCTNCYAMRLAGTRLRNHPSREGLTQPSKAGPVWTGKIYVNEKHLLMPLRWKKPRMIFWNAHGDLFHDNVPDEVIDRCLAVMMLASQHIHQVLTKRSPRMRAWMERLETAIITWFLRCDPDALNDQFPHIATSIAHPGGPRKWPPPNLWLGISAEDQPRFDERWRDLQATPAAVRFISGEPLLGRIDLPNFRAVKPDWFIAGGESGPRFRDMQVAWAAQLLAQCQEQGIAFFMKQMAGKAEIPPGLLVREFPQRAGLS